MSGDEVGLKENIGVYHNAMASHIDRVFTLLDAGQTKEARKAMKMIIIYSGENCGTTIDTKKLDDLEEMELLREMARVTKKAGFSPIQNVRTELLYDRILERYMDPEFRKNVNKIY